jgi:hypothetical protein
MALSLANKKKKKPAAKKATATGESKDESAKE